MSWFDLAEDILLIGLMAWWAAHLGPAAAAQRRLDGCLAAARRIAVRRDRAQGGIGDWLAPGALRRARRDEWQPHVRALLSEAGLGEARLGQPLPIGVVAACIVLLTGDGRFSHIVTSDPDLQDDMRALFVEAP